MEKSLKVIRVGGVPEHFNMPWHWAMEQGLFKEKGLDVSWQDFPGGTGAMNRALRQQEIDIALVLTEGIVTDIINGNPSKLVQFYVNSPLVWGIHVPANSDIQHLDDLKKRPFAISRKGSGSHLMASILAQDLGWEPDDLIFEVVGNLTGARKAMAEGTAFGFLWEKFTTKPYVDNGEFRRIGVLPTPWPCFSIAVREEFLLQNESAVQQLLTILNHVCSSWKTQEELPKRIAERYQLELTDVQQWLSITEWNSQQHLPQIEIEKVISRLLDNGIIHKKPENIAAILA